MYYYAYIYTKSRTSWTTKNLKLKYDKSDKKNTNTSPYIYRAYNSPAFTEMADMRGP